MWARENNHAKVVQYLEAAAAGKARKPGVGAQASAAFFSAGSVTQDKKYKHNSKKKSATRVFP